MRSLFSLPLLWCLPLAAAAGEPQFIGGVFDPPREAPDFSLAASDGNELRLSDYRGKVVLLGFGFTSCPEVCPTTLAVLAMARDKLGDDAGEVQVLYVTVDPDTDTPERMRDYLRGFDESFLGATGTAEQLDAVRRDYGVIANRIPHGVSEGKGYTYAHSSYVYLIDRSGRIRALMPYGHKPEDFAHDLRLLIEEQ
ncbi:MAG TPA: SCO family protein [Woeseiaceae bacterium]|nr:SCO family protein [Woeseiaceae bacterium]